jgi:hypothetical protein
MKTRTLYTVSPHLFAEPEYWPWNARVVGYHEKQANVDWTPHSDLLDFLAKHEKVLLITFGSMENPEPEKKSSIIFELLRELKSPRSAPSPPMATATSAR